MAKARGKRIVQQELGGLRTFAAVLKRQQPDLDEEALFALAAQNWLAGIKRELSTLFGVEKTTELLDVWHHGKI